MALINLNIDYLLSELDKSFYTMPLMIALNILFLVIAVKYRSYEKSFKVFILYGLLFLIENTAGITLSLFDKVVIKNTALTTRLGEYSTLVFVQIEFVAFYVFFCHQLSQQRIQNKIAVTGKVYALATMLVTLATCFNAVPFTIKDLTAYISIANSIMVLIPAFYYFYTLFVEPPVKNLLQEPSFWITTGIAFLQAINIPIFLIENYLIKQFLTVWYSMYSISYIAYCILFILLIISLLCNRQSAAYRKISSCTVEYM